MVDQTDFKHITVTASEDDDIVIVAGAPEKAERPASGQERLSANTNTDEVQNAALEPDIQKTDASQKKSENVYRATTLEDIESSKMSTMQKTIIVLAVLAIAAFAAWCVFFM